MHEWVNNELIPGEISNSWTCSRCDECHWGTDHKPPPEDMKVFHQSETRMLTCDEATVARIMER